MSAATVAVALRCGTLLRREVLDEKTGQVRGTVYERCGMHAPYATIDEGATPGRFHIVLRCGRHVTANEGAEWPVLSEVYEALLSEPDRDGAT